MNNRIRRISVLLLTGAITATMSFACSAKDEALEAVLAMESDSEYGAYLAAECLTCHTPTGANGNIPQIHAKDKADLATALLEYKNKTRENEVMRGITAALTNEDIAALVTYLSEHK